MTREMSKNKITFTAQRAKFLLAILVTSLITGMAFFWPPMLTQAQGTTPESCFSFYNGTISYYFDTNPNCPSDVVIPEKIR